MVSRAAGSRAAKTHAAVSRTAGAAGSRTAKTRANGATETRAAGARANSAAETRAAGCPAAGACAAETRAAGARVVWSLAATFPDGVIEERGAALAAPRARRAPAGSDSLLSLRARRRGAIGLINSRSSGGQRGDGRRVCRPRQADR